MNATELAAVIAIIRKEVEKRAAIDGKDGLDGKDGNDAALPEFKIKGVDLYSGDTNLGRVVGVDGKDGRDGTDGRNGSDGTDGKDGRDGVDGTDGKPGVGIREVYVDPDDGHLYVEFTNGRVTDAGIVKGKDGKPGKNGGGSVVTITGGGSGIADTFETVSKNLSSAGAVMGYSGGDLVTITYSNGIIKTLAYSIDSLSSVTLSGNTPSGISLVKSFQYLGGDLIGYNYS